MARSRRCLLNLCSFRSRRRWIVRRAVRAEHKTHQLCSHASWEPRALPSQYSSRERCGGIHQGWLPTGPVPEACRWVVQTWLWFQRRRPSWTAGERRPVHLVPGSSVRNWPKAGWTPTRSNRIGSKTNPRSLLLRSSRTPLKNKKYRPGGAVPFS